jgi:hypothetical protein
VLGIQLRDKQDRGFGPIRKDEEEERPFQRLEACPRQVIDAVELGDKEQVEVGLGHLGPEVCQAIAVF